MATSSVELDGMCDIEATATPISVQLDSNALYELASSAPTPAELGSDFGHSLPSTFMAGMNNEDPPVASLYRMPPLVSPMSSMDQSQPSTRTESWFTSQNSAISAFPTETTHSFTNDDRTSSTTESSRPKLPVLTTSWLCPPSDDLPISQITESPTDISAADQLSFPTLFGSTPDGTYGSQAQPAELAAAHVSKSDSFDEMLMDLNARPGHVEQHPFILGNAAIIAGTHDDASAPMDGEGLGSHSISADVTDETDDGLVTARLLAACEDYASILHEDCPNEVVGYLGNIFSSTWKYCHQRFRQPNPMNGVDLEAFWPGEPSIDAGLEGLRDLMSEGWSTSHRLVSLVLLSFSLLCVSLPEDQDLRLAVLCLHQSARSWTAYVYNPMEALLLPAFVDNLWELAEQDQPQSDVSCGGQSDNILPDLISAYVSGRRDFVLEIARRFIDATLTAGLLASSETLPQSRCVVDAPPSYADALHEPVLTPLAFEAGLGYPESAKAYPPLNERLVNDYTARRTTGPDDVLGILREHDLRKDSPNIASISTRYTVPVIRAGFIYLATASRWVLTTLQRSAHRVVSDPTGLTPPRRSATAPEILQASLSGSAYHDNMSPSRLQPTRASSSRSKHVQRSRSKAASKRAPKKSHFTDEVVSFRCDLHNVSFTGRYARGAYHKHMTSTIAHNVKRLPCPCCEKAFPRPDHLKTHCKDEHGVQMTGRAGKYQFQNMAGSKIDFAKGKMRAVTW